MNIFQLAADLTHVFSVLLLLLKIYTFMSCAGISLKTQELYFLVFATRYLDVFTDFLSFYNTLMKLIFLGSSSFIVWCMRRHRIVKKSYDKEQDTFKHYLLVAPCAVLALLIMLEDNHMSWPFWAPFLEVPWTFSLYLEAVAIVPQLVLLRRTKSVDNLTANYVFLLGGYRLLYIINWIYRAFTETHYVQWRKWISGIVQVLLYAKFFHYYIKRYTYFFYYYINRSGEFREEDQEIFEAVEDDSSGEFRVSFLPESSSLDLAQPDSPLPGTSPKEC